MRVHPDATAREAVERVLRRSTRGLDDARPPLTRDEALALRGSGWEPGGDAGPAARS